MPEVDVRWRPSGGRGEYEHVPGDLLMDRRIVIDPLSIPGGRIYTDVRGRQKDGKPRLRRDAPKDKSLLNVPALVAALALLPDPMREDKGVVSIPLKDKKYVISSITFHVEYLNNDDALCTPIRMNILHDSTVVDINGRLREVGGLLSRSDLPPDVLASARQYQRIVLSGTPSAELRSVANTLRGWLQSAPGVLDQIDSPSTSIAPENAELVAESIEAGELSVDETKRRLVSHYKIDRDRGIIKAKIDQFCKENGSVFCEACGFDFEEKYGEYAKGVIDVHHIKPLSSLLPNTMTKLSDLMLLCSNCHRVIHRRRTPLTREDLLKLINDAED
jgi:hypothetical protein